MGLRIHLSAPSHFWQVVVVFEFRVQVRKSREWQGLWSLYRGLPRMKVGLNGPKGPQNSTLEENLLAKCSKGSLTSGALKKDLQGPLRTSRWTSGSLYFQTVTKSQSGVISQCGSGSLEVCRSLVLRTSKDLWNIYLYYENTSLIGVQVLSLLDLKI